MSNANDTTLYIGVTNDIGRRVKEHRSGQIPGFTQKYNCQKLVYYETYSDIDQAIEREKKLKKWRREKKDWLINTMNPDLKDLYEESMSEISRLGQGLLEMTRRIPKK